MLKHWYQRESNIYHIYHPNNNIDNNYQLYLDHRGEILNIYSYEMYTKFT